MMKAFDHYDQGNDFYEQGQWDLAIEEYSLALELNPQYAKAYSIRGDAYTKLGDTEQAMVDLNRAITLDPELA